MPQNVWGACNRRLACRRARLRHLTPAQLWSSDVGLTDTMLGAFDCVHGLGVLGSLESMDDREDCISVSSL